MVITCEHTWNEEGEASLSILFLSPYHYSIILTHSCIHNVSSLTLLTSYDSFYLLLLGFLLMNHQGVDVLVHIDIHTIYD